MKVCSECGSSRIEISLPAWFDANTYGQTGTDDDADVQYTYCHDCDESRCGDWTKEIEDERPAQSGLFDWMLTWPGEENKA